MAWQRDEANLGISGATAYSYTEVDWEVHGDKCTYRHIGGVTSPYNFGATATSTLQWWESGTWHDYAGPASGTFNGYGDLALVDVEDHFVRQAADRVVSLGCYTTMMGGSARAWIDYTVPHLAPSVNWAASNPVVRNSDNSITLTWDAPALEYSAMCLEVSTDGGAWSQFAVLWNTATSYTWTGCSAGHSYQFRIRTNYLASYSAYDTCATVIVNTPLPPESISTAAAGGTSVTVTLVNPSAVATKVQYQVSNDDGATWGATQDSASLTSFTVTITGTGKVKAWNYNSTGVSAAIETESITTICPPAKPTVNSPQSGDVWDVSKPLVVEWVHNTLDGSAQTAAKVMLVKDTVPPVAHTETLDPFTGNTHSIDFATAQSWISGLAVGDALKVAVKTKGADASYSSNTVVNGIKAYTAPTLNITSPSASVTSMPVSIAATYSDMAGFTCQAATVTLKAGDRTILTKPATISGTSLTCDISPSDAILDNGATYTIVLDVRSSSGLQSTANATFSTAFVPPKAGDLQISNDPDTGYVSLLAQVSDDEQASTGLTDNLSPFFSHDLTDTAFWDTITTSYITQGSDGWAHFEVNNTGSSTVYVNFTTKPAAKPASLKPATDYTFLLEARNFSISSGTLYTVVTSQQNDSLVDAFTNDSTRAQYISSDGAYTLPSRTRDSISALRWFTRGFVAVGAGVRVSADLRISLYEGTYTGEYQTPRNFVPLDTSAGDYLHSVEIQGGAQRFVPTFTDYAGNTNTQYDSTAGSVGRLTVEGMSKKWNQLAPAINTTNWSAYNNSFATFAASDGVGTLTVVNNTGTNYGVHMRNKNYLANVLDGHYYYMTAETNPSVNVAEYTLRITVPHGTDKAVNLGKGATANTWTRIDGIIQSGGTGQEGGKFGFAIHDGNVGAGATISFRNPVAIDLTAIFGSGNEPATVDAFKATDVYKAKAAGGTLYTYDAGSLVSIGGSVERWNQLFDNAAPSETVNGTQFTNNEDGTWNVTGAYSSTPFKYVTDAPMQPSHKLLVMQGTTPSNAYVRVGFDSYVGAAWRDTKIASGTMEILSTYSACDNIKPFVIVDAGWIATDDIKLTPRIIDLTAIYGAGNEPTSTSDARVTALATYAATHYDYEANGVMEGSEGGVEVRGRNILDVFTEFPKADTTYQGCTIVNNGDGSFTVSGKNTSTSGWNFNSAAGSLTLPAGTYTLQGNGTLAGVGGSNVCYVGFRINGTNYALDASHPEPRTLTFAQDAVLDRWYVWVGGSTRISGTCYPMIVEGDQGAPWEPYSLTTIPALLRSAGTVHDQLQVAKTDVKVARKVGYVDLGSVDWYYASSSKRFNTVSQLTNCKIVANWDLPTLISNNYEKTNVSNTDDGKTNIYGVYNGYAYAKDTNYTSAASFKTAMSGVYLFYELATPTEEQMTDIEVMEIGTAFTVATDLDSTFAMKATADLFDPYVLTTTGTGTVSGGSISHQAISLTTSGETYADVLDGEWLAGIGDIKDTASIGATTTIERRIGCVDLGTLNWARTSYNGVYFFTVDVSDSVQDNYRIHSVCSEYESVTSANFIDFLDKMIRIFNTRVQVHDDYYLTSAAFKTAMSGVLLYYELATPTTVTVTGTDYAELNVPDWLTLNAYQDSPITARYGNGIEDVESISVARVNADGSITPLLEDGQAGAGIVDKYAPLNTPYQYAVTTMSSAHAVNTVYVDNFLQTDRWFAYWTKRRGETVTEEIASAKWNPANGGIKLTRPQRERVFFAGRADPVSFDGQAVSMAESPSWLQVEKGDADRFVQLIQDGGRGVYKSCDGWVYHADFELTLNPAYIAIGYYGSMLLNITRIAGGLL